MNVEQLRGWVKHRPAGALRLQLVVETKGGDLNAIAVWERTDIDALEDPNTEIATTVLSQAQEFTDAETERCKFLVRWLGNRDRVLKAVTHRCSPTPSETPGQSQVRNPEDLISVLVEQNKNVLDAMLEQNKQVTSSVKSITEGFSSAISALTEKYNEANRELRRKPSPELVAAVADLSPEQREEVIQRTEALRAFTGKVPEIADLLMALASEKWLRPAPKQGNGASKRATTKTQPTSPPIDVPANGEPTP